MRIILTTLIILMISLSHGAAWAKIRVYEPDMSDSRWMLAPFHPLSCRITQVIPGYGEAVFQQLAGKKTNFEVRVKVGGEEAGSGLLSAVPPAWSPQTKEKYYGQFKLQPGKTPITLDNKETRWIMAQLEQGWFPSFEHLDWDNSADSTVLRLSAINFKSALYQYHDCLAQLLPYGFSDIQTSKIMYGPGSTRLSSKDTALLQKIVRYIEVDPDVQKIILKGYSDSVGTRRQNYLVSINRLRAIEEYFMEKGIPEKMIDATAYGERQPVASNRTTTGRAKNRRVTIFLIK